MKNILKHCKSDFLQYIRSAPDVDCLVFTLGRLKELRPNLPVQWTNAASQKVREYIKASPEEAPAIMSKVEKFLTAEQVMPLHAMAREYYAEHHHVVRLGLTRASRLGTTFTPSP